MNPTFAMAVVASAVGAVDALYFHLWRYRLYRQPSSVREQLSHTVRGVAFMAIVAILVECPGAPWAGPVVLGLFVLDVVNTVVDVRLEQRSRAPLGGLSNAEYLLHVLGSTCMGVFGTTFFWQWQQGAAGAPRSALELLVGRGMLLLGGALLTVELALFLQAVLARRAQPLAAG